MKKILCLAIAVLMTSSLIACSSGNKENSGSNLPETSAPTVVGEKVEAGREINVNVLKVTADGVNIRSEANTDCDVLGTAKNNEYYTYISTADGWNKFKYNGEDAYISADFSSVESVSQEQAKTLIQDVDSTDSDEANNGDDTTETDGSTEDDDTTNADATDTTNTEDGEA